LAHAGPVSVSRSLWQTVQRYIFSSAWGEVSAASAILKTNITASGSAIGARRLGVLDMTLGAEPHVAIQRVVPEPYSESDEPGGV
jgi:hypothetical protein